MLNQAILDRLVAPLQEAVLDAGVLLMSYREVALDIGVKHDGSLVSEADKAVNAFLITRLSALLPRAGIISEEADPIASDGSGYDWVIDPLDGTNNFLYGIPYFAISVGLTYNGAPCIGAVYNPVAQEFFFARTGHGAFLNGRRLFNAWRGDWAFNRSLISVCLPYEASLKGVGVAVTQKLRSAACTTREFGAAALDLAYVAAGRLDATFMGRLKWWDVAAGMLLVTEAGGLVADDEGKPLRAGFSGCVAARTELHGDILRIIVESK